MSLHVGACREFLSNRILMNVWGVKAEKPGCGIAKDVAHALLLELEYQCAFQTAHSLFKTLLLHCAAQKCVDINCLKRAHFTCDATIPLL